MWIMWQKRGTAKPKAAGRRHPRAGRHLGLLPAR